MDVLLTNFGDWEENHSSFAVSVLEGYSQMLENSLRVKIRNWTETMFISAGFIYHH